jgi:hypothetical protein
MNSGKNTKMDSLTKLKIEKVRLAAYCSYQEKLIGLKYDYFRENYSTVLGESLLPYDEKQNVKVSELLDAVNGVITKLLPGTFEGRFLPGFILKLIQVVMIHMVNNKKAKG